MLTGKQFRLKTETLGIESSNGKRTALMIPAGAIVQIVSGPRPDDQRMIDVAWRGRMLVLFAEDIQHRGEEILTSSNS